MMNHLIELLHSGNFSCVIAQGDDVRSFTQRGVADLYDLYNSVPQFLKGASIADKVVGKGAAALMVKGGIASLYTDIISETALELLRSAGIPVEFKNCVPFIINREGTGSCPLEKRCIHTNSVDEILPIIDDFISNIRGKMAVCVM